MTARGLDLLNEPLPTEWASTRHCPDCGGTDLRTVSDEIEVGGWCTTYCRCGRKLRVDTIDADGLHIWEDPEWAKAGEQ